MRKLLSLLTAVLLVGSVWGSTVTYTTSSGSPVASGTIITGASASFADETNQSNHTQMLQNGWVQLTLTNLGGINVSNITMSMKSNKKGGAGKLLYSTNGGTSWTYVIGTSSEGVGFNQSAWNGSYVTDYTNISKTVSISNITQLIIKIESTANSLYCESFTLTYAAAGPSLSSISVKTAPTKVTYKEGEFFNPAGLVITGTYSDESTADIAYSGNETDFSFSPSLTTALTTSDESVTITYKTKTANQAITVTGCSSSITITKGTPENGTFDITGTGTVCIEGGNASVTISNIEPAEGYRFKQITSSGGGTIDNDAKTVTNISANTTINVEFEAIPTHSIIFNTNGVAEIANATVAEGATYKITQKVTSGLSSGCTYDTFMGWTLASSIADASVLPALVTSVEMGNSDVTVYAVYRGNATDVTINFGYSDWGKTAQFSGDTNDEISQEVDGVLVTDVRNTGSLYANTTTTRFYKANELTFESQDYIVEIVFTVSTYQTDITSNVGTCTATSSEFSWKGSAKSVTFTRPSDASSYAAFSSAVVTTSESAPEYSLDADCGGGTSLDNTEVSEKAVKKLVNGQLFIESNGHVYNAMGQMVK